MRGSRRSISSVRARRGHVSRNRGARLLLPHAQASGVVTSSHEGRLHPRGRHRRHRHRLCHAQGIVHRSKRRRARACSTRRAPAGAATTCRTRSARGPARRPRSCGSAGLTCWPPTPSTTPTSFRILSTSPYSVISFNTRVSIGPSTDRSTLIPPDRGRRPPVNARGWGESNLCRPTRPRGHRR